MFKKLKYLEVYIDTDDYRTLQYYCLFCKAFIDDYKENGPFEHIKFHLNKTENECVVCNVKFIKFNTFIKHMKSNCGVTTTTTTTTTEINCKSIKNCITNKISSSSRSIISTNTAVPHRQYPTSLIVFKCLYCNQEFSSPHDRLKHITNHLQTLHKCDKYSKCVNNSNDFLSHYNSDHTQRKQLKPKNTNTNNENNSIIINTLRKSKTDNNDINTNVSIIDKVTIEKNRSLLSSSINGDITNHENTLNVTNTITEKPLKKVKTIDDYFICHICGWRFSDRRNLRTHFVVHTRERNYECKVCHKRFSVAYTVKEHMRLHTGEKPFPCKLCNKKYHTSGLLTKHVNDAHTRIKRHQCVYCDKKFMRKEYVQAHIRTHTGEKPYTCDLCNTSFTKASTMRTHRRLHTGEKPYQCGCGKLYAQRAGLYGHMKTHKHVEMKPAI